MKFDDGVRYTGLITIDPSGVGGDSGAVLVVNGNMAGGLYIGAGKGSGYCHQMVDVLKKLKVQLWT